MQPLTGAFLIACPICRSGRMIRIERFLGTGERNFLDRQLMSSSVNIFRIRSTAALTAVHEDVRSIPTNALDRSQKLDASEAP